MLKPTVGPITGHTTSGHARIFLRGDHQKNSVIFAGIRYRQSREEQWAKSVFAQLVSSRDMTDVIVLNGLAANTAYEYQAGWFSLPDPTHTVASVQQLPLQWPNELYRFRTLSEQLKAPRAYIVGSCRYLRMTAGMASAPQWGDRIFASINKLAQHAEPAISAMLMTGDQI